MNHGSNPSWSWQRMRRLRVQWFFRRNASRVIAAFSLAVLVTAVYVTSFYVTPRISWQLTPSGQSSSTLSISVIDGDTILVNGRSVRLVGFNAPETTGARCEGERRLGDRATARLRQLVADDDLEFREVRCACRPGTEGTNDCNYGRACGELRSKGRDVGSILISEGLARPYHCSTTSCPPRRPWCPHL